MKAKRYLLLTILCYALSLHLSAQSIIGRQKVDQYPTTWWGTTTYGLTWLPTDYTTNTTQKYPLLIFLHGIGETGNGPGGLWSLLNAGLPQTIANGWDPEAVNPADGQNYKFIVVSPQASTSVAWSYQWNSVQYILADVVNRYRIDTSRIYVSGLSAGGNGAWTCLTSGPDAAKKFAAAVPISSAPLPTDSISKLGSDYGVKLWSICGDADAFYNFSVAATAAYNSTAPNPQTTLTTFTGQGHWSSVWNTAYDPNWRSNAHNKNIYEWMLQYKRTPATQSLTVAAGNAQTITLPTNQVTLSGTAIPASGDNISGYTWTKQSGPAGGVIQTASNASTLITGLTQGTYVFQLTAVTVNAQSASATVQVTVNAPANIPPVANAGSDISIQLPLNTAGLSGTASDADGTIASVQWTKLTGPAGGTIATPNQSATNITALQQGIYSFQFQVTDNNGAIAKDTVQVTVLAAANIIPIANAGQDINITLPLDSVTLSGSGADQDGSVVSYHWTAVSGPASFVIVSAAQAQTVVNGLVPGTYVFELRVTDNDNGIGKDSVTITVSAASQANTPPVAFAGNDMVISLPTDSILLSGTGTDADGNIASYHWNKIVGGAASIQHPDSSHTVVNGLSQGSYKFELIVTDNDGATARDTVMITVAASAANGCNGHKIYLTPNSGDHGKQISGDPTSYWYLPVNPGDTLVLQSQHAWTYLRMDNYYGTASCPIVITNEGGQVWMKDGIDAQNVHYLKITGSGAPNVYYGIKVFSPVFDGYSVAIGISGKTKHVEVERMDVLHKGYGVWAKQDPQCDASFNYPNYVMDDIAIHHCRFKKIWQDCIYAGNTDPLGDRIVYCNGQETHPIPMRMSNVDLHHLIIDSCGRTGIQLSGADGGINKIHDNVVTNCGYEYNQWQGTGITIGGMTRNCYVYNNVVKNTFLYGIFDLGADSSFIYNNTVDSSGFLKIDPLVDINAIASSTNTTALPGHWLKNTMSMPGNIQATTRITIPQYSKTVFYRNNKVGVNASTIAPEGIIAFGWWGPAEDWTTNNRVCGNTRLNGTTPAKIDPFWYTTLNQYWPVMDTACTTLAPNVPPVANAGSDTTLALGIHSVHLLGSATDVDGTIASYHWTKVSGPLSFSIAQPDSAHTLVNALVPGIYTFRLTAADNAGAQATDEVTIAVAPPNDAPIANAGAFKVVTLPQTSITITGSAVDPNADSISYVWTKVSGPSSYSISSPNQPVTTFSNLVPGVYKFELAASDNYGGIDRDTTRIDVNIPPTANAGPDQAITLPVNTVNVSGTSADVDGTMSSFQWTKISGPATYTILAPANPQTAITNLVEGVYTFEFRASDNFDAPARDTLQITVYPAPNTPPVANAGNDITIQLPLNSVTLNGSGVDNDGTIASYNWVMLSGAPGAAMSSSNTASNIVSGLVAGDYQFQLTVTDDDGATATDIIVVHVLPAANIPPVANAGADIAITLPTNFVNLNGSATDADGTVVSYQWTKISGPSSYIITNPALGQTQLTVLVQGVYALELRATDNNGASAADTVLITVNPAPNQPPVANAGTNQSITLPVNSIILNGSATDADGTVVTYLWSVMSGPAGAVIANAGQPVTTLSNLVQGTYVLRLTVTDNDGAGDVDDIMVVVNPAPPPPPVNIPPVANAGSDISITLPVNAVTLTGSATDVDGVITAYQWTKLSGPAAYTIATPGFAQTQLSGLVQGVYEMEFLTVDNNGATGRDTVLVTVHPAPNVAPTANAGNDITITLPVNATNLTGAGVDADGTIVSYQWTKLAGPASFVITSPTQAQTNVSGLVQGVYGFELKVTDNDGAIATDTVLVTVLAAPPPPNVAPTASAGNDISITLPVNAANLSGAGSDTDGTIVSYQWTKLSGPASFVIASATQAQTNVSGLVQGVYGFELRVTDNDGAIATDTVMVTVLAAPPPPNVAPVVNAGNDITITLPLNSVNLNGSATDPDGVITGYQWTRISGPAAYNFATPQLAQTVFSGLVQGVYQIEFLAVDNNGAIARDTMLITVNAAPNVAPVVSAGTDITITLPVNTVTLNGIATDADGTVASYQWTKLGGPAASTIVSATQAQTVVSGMVQGVYSFELKVTDNAGATAVDTVIVTVLPVPNVAPVAHAGNDVVIFLPTNSAVLVGSGSDADGTIVSYQWNKLSGPVANIGTPGNALTGVTALVQGTYSFELVVTDNKGAQGRDTMNLIVKPASANQSPVVNAGVEKTVLLPIDSVTVKGIATDADGTVVSYNWTKLSGPAQYTIVNPASPTTRFEHLVEGDYFFELKATDNWGAVGRDTVKISVYNTARLNTVTTLFPNPATSEITVRIAARTQKSQCMVRIYSSTGALMYSESFMRNSTLLEKTITVSSFITGNYLVVVEPEINKQVTLKFTKQ